MEKYVPGRALIVGVSRYSNVKPLPLAVINDANDVADALIDEKRCGYDPASVTLLTDNDATTAKIINALNQHADKVVADEPFLFFFSGHGDQQDDNSGSRSFLLSQEADVTRLNETALSDVVLLECLRRIPSKRQVVILDACHSGAIGTLKSTKNAEPKGISDATTNILSSGRGRVISTSCRADESSMILSGMRNSVFTSSLLDALSGQARVKDDGTIGVLDLFDFVSKSVSEHASQHPLFKADGLESNFSIIRAPTQIAVQPFELTSAPRASEIVDLLAEILPLGPTQNEIWSRAGGDLSRLSLAGHGRAQWHSAISMIGRGGGAVTTLELLEIVFSDFPHNDRLKQLLGRLQ